MLAIPEDLTKVQLSKIDNNNFKFSIPKTPDEVIVNVQNLLEQRKKIVNNLKSIDELIAKVKLLGVTI